MRFKFYLTLLVRFFQFAEKRKQERLRQDIERFAAEREAKEERERERQHQIHIIELLATKLVEFAKANNEGVLKLAEAQTAQAQVLAEWMKGFQTPSLEPVAPQPMPQDEWENPFGIKEEDVRAGVGNIPPEFRLALALQNETSLDFDREGRDNESN